MKRIVDIVFISLVIAAFPMVFLLRARYPDLYVMWAILVFTLGIIDIYLQDHPKVVK